MKTTYSSSSNDDEVLLGSSVSKCLLLQELPMQQYKMLRPVFT